MCVLLLFQHCLSSLTLILQYAWADSVSVLSACSCKAKSFCNNTLKDILMLLFCASFCTSKDRCMCSTSIYLNRCSCFLKETVLTSISICVLDNLGILYISQFSVLPKSKWKDHSRNEPLGNLCVFKVWSILFLCVVELCCCLNTIKTHEWAALLLWLTC